MAPQQPSSMDEQTGEPCEPEAEKGEKEGPGPPLGESEPATIDAPDGGWGWVVLLATILVLALTLAFPSCIGIFYVDLQTEFKASNSETSWVPSIMIAVLHAGGPLCSVLVERFGCRATVMFGGVLSGLGMAVSSFTHSILELYITAGVITGLGFCLSFQPAVTILGHYFVRRRPFANAMSSTGTALGLSTLPFLGDYLHSELGWRGSFLVLGAVLLNCCVCGAVMRPLRPRKPRITKAVKNAPPSPDKKRLKVRMQGMFERLASSLRRHMAFDLFSCNLRFRVFSLGITWMMLGFVVPLIYLVPYATAYGMDQSRAALLLSILGFVNIFVRPPIGVLFGLPWFKGRHIYVFSVALFINGLSNSICCIAASFPVLLIYVLTYGLSMSVIGSLMFTVLMDTVEMNRFPSALGLLSIMESVTLLVGPPLAGSLVDSTGLYTYVFLACSISVALSALFLIVSFYWLDCRDAAQKDNSPASGSPAKPAVTLSTSCQYSSVPTDGDKTYNLSSERENITEI
ncbi:monocarboxylate transporter 6 [Myxocyprinus asiaticus]|uniref:monocarboxylate transporter 6 n=1 Tax=Myxocyprinus asiaticus TaxID=70543 RepID=UPI002223C458|nr:monocarboxylate transporter 6 [Myxocyprinus asiaticus]XP_051522474.1 monocarboxylate transporter 6 [Myxocyprinus asiaticus]